MIIEEICKIMDSEKIPAYGICSSSKMTSEPPSHRPQDLLSGAQSLICFGIPLPRGIYITPIHTLEAIWRFQSIYYRLLDTISVRIAALLEENGALAVPTNGCMPLGMNRKGEVIGYFNQIQMGIVTGIGFLGRNGLLIHPKYGARLMLGGVITTAELPELHDSIINVSNCPPDCRICVKTCPVNAISVKEGRVKIMRCLSYTARTPLMSRIIFALIRAFSKEKAARFMSLRAFDEHTFHICSQCVALCPFGNEK